jgi:hypothetical protein
MPVVVADRSGSSSNGDDERIVGNARGIVEASPDARRQQIRKFGDNLGLGRTARSMLSTSVTRTRVPATIGRASQIT